MLRFFEVKTFWPLYAVFIGGCAMLWLTHCGPSALSPAQQAAIGTTVTDVAKCQVLGRETNSYAVYDRCMCSAGYRDGGCAPVAPRLDTSDPWADGGSDAGK